MSSSGNSFVPLSKVPQPGELAYADQSGERISWAVDDEGSDQPSIPEDTFDTLPRISAPTVRDLARGDGLPYPLAPHLIAEQVLGYGGTAVVFLALHTRLNLKVAVKVRSFDVESTLAGCVRLHREAEICARLGSRFLPHIYDVDHFADGTPFVVMEYIQGPTLCEVIEEGALEVDAACHIACQVLEALEELHEAGVVHRDIKPSNLIVQDGDDGLHVRLLDLGIAKAMHGGPVPQGPALTKEGERIGTPHYMAPEQLCAGDVDARTDLYAASVLMYEMLTGNLPFAGDSTGEVIASVLRDTPERLRRVRPEVPEALDDLIFSGMQRAPDDRPQSAQAMLHRLRSLREQPPTGRIPAHLGPTLARSRAPELADAGGPAATPRVRRATRIAASLTVVAAAGVALWWPGGHASQGTIGLEELGESPKAEATPRRETSDPKVADDLQGAPAQVIDVAAGTLEPTERRALGAAKAPGLGEMQIQADERIAPRGAHKHRLRRLRRGRKASSAVDGAAPVIEGLSRAPGIPLTPYLEDFDRLLGSPKHESTSDPNDRLPLPDNPY